MLIIRFYNRKQKYVKSTGLFPYQKIGEEIRKSLAFAQIHPEISGWTIYKYSCGEWIPFQPFNRNIQYCCRS